MASHHFHLFGVVLARFFFPQFSIVDSKTVQRSALCRSRRELSHEYWYVFSICLQILASIQPRTNLVKFARSVCTDPSGIFHLASGVGVGLSLVDGRRISLS